MKLRSFSRAVSGAMVLLLFALTTAVCPAQSDLGALRAKAESGNAVAQYNLGMAYLDGQQVPKDVIEAYVWLTLAAENGATGKALKTLAPTLSADQLAAAATRLAERRGVISDHLVAQSAPGAPGPRAVRTPEPAPVTVHVPEPAPVAAPAPAAPAPVTVRIPDPAPAAPPPASPAAAPASAADSDHIAALAKEVAALRADNAKLSAEVLSVWKELDAAKVAEASAARRADRADAAAKQGAIEVTALETERDQLRQQLKDAQAAPKPAAAAPVDDSQVKALAAAEAGRAKAAADAESARRELAAIQTLNKELDAQVDRLAGENAALKVQSSARDEAGRKLAEAQAALTRLQAENAELKARPVVAPAAAASAEELAGLKQELARAKQTVEMTVRSFALARQENEQLKARLAAIQQAAGGASDAAAKPAPASR